MNDALEIKVNGVEPMGITTSEKGFLLYIVNASEYGIIHKLKATQIKRDRLALIAPASAWRAAFPSYYVKDMPDWKKAAAWLAHECQKRGEWKEPPPALREVTYEDWLTSMNIGDWFHTESDPGVPEEFHIEKYNAIKYHVTNSKVRQGREFVAEWIEDENRGKITRIK